MLLRRGADDGRAAGVLVLDHLEMRVEALIAPEGQQAVNGQLCGRPQKRRRESELDFGTLVCSLRE